MAHCLSLSMDPLMTAVEETGGCVPLSELVTGVTTRRCRQWVFPIRVQPPDLPTETSCSVTTLILQHASDILSVCMF